MITNTIGIIAENDLDTAGGTNSGIFTCNFFVLASFGKNSPIIQEMIIATNNPCAPKYVVSTALTVSLANGAGYIIIKTDKLVNPVSNSSPSFSLANK